MENVMPKILVSACLLGQKVRYDGKDCLQDNPRLQALIASGEVITICPEMAGGMPTPRPPAEIQGEKTGSDVLNGEAVVRTVDGLDVTTQFFAGAYKALNLASDNDVRVAILKARSPSCGSKQIYNGQFTKTLISGMGVTAALFSEHGIKVYDEDHIEDAINALEAF